MSNNKKCMLFIYLYTFVFFTRLTDLNDTNIFGVAVVIVAVVISFSAILAVTTNCSRPVAAAFLLCVVCMCCMIIKMFAKWCAQHSHNEWW